jgi:putative flavoprotein involved in K+ transport
MMVVFHRLRSHHQENEVMTTSPATQLIEEGAVAMALTRRAIRPAADHPDVFDVIVIGGGQAGLSVGYHLAKTGVRFVILDAHARIGDAWRKRWDSLRLFTPAKFDGLDGMPFPADGNYFPTKDEMADYLEAYARRFKLPVRSGVRVQRVLKRDDRFVVVTGTQELQAAQVVVAMAKYQRPRTPAFAEELSPDIVQLHSIDYRNAGQLKPGGVLLAGGGNSGADLALESARAGHKVWLAGPDVGEVPFRPESFLGRNVMGPLVIGFVFHRVLTVKTPMGRRAQPGAFTRAVPLIRIKRRDLKAAGIERVARVVGARDRLPLLADGRVLEVSNVIWASGFHPGFDWIELPVFDEHGAPRHRSGVVDAQPGLYFVGLPFLHAMSSSMIHGVGRDAARIVGDISTRNAAQRRTAATPR